MFATQEQRLRRHRRAAGVQLAAARAPHREPGQHGQAGPVRLQGPRQRGRCDLRLRRVRDDHRLLGAATAASSAMPSSPTASRTLPYYPDVPGAPQNTVIGGASLWVMSGKKPEEYKGVAAFFNYLSQARSAVGQPQAHRLPAGHHGLVRADREVRLLQGEPGHRRRGDADDPQDHRQVARHPPGQLRADPHHHRRGDSSRSGPARSGRRKRWTAPSSAATSSSSASRRRTRADARRSDAGTPSPPPSAAGFVSTVAWKSASASESGWLPWVLIAPQMAIILVFFFWPAGQALLPERAAARTPSAPRPSSSACENFERAVRTTRPTSTSFQTTAIFSVLVAVLRPGDLAAAGGVGRPRDPRRGLLQDAADLALRGGAGGGRRAVAVHVRAARRASSATR